MILITIIASMIGLLIISIPASFALGMAQDLYKELFQERWIDWIRKTKFKAQKHREAKFQDLKDFLKNIDEQKKPK
jgi:hypothetical protein